MHYIFPRRTLNAAGAFNSLQNASSDVFQGEEAKVGVIVVWDVAYDWLAGAFLLDVLRKANRSDEIEKVFGAKANFPISFAHIRSHTVTDASSSSRQADKAPSLRSIEPPTGLMERDCAIWYIGEEGRALLNLQMNHADCPVRVAIFASKFD